MRLLILSSILAALCASASFAQVKIDQADVDGLPAALAAKADKTAIPLAGFAFDAGTQVLSAYTSPAKVIIGATTIRGWYLRGDASGSVVVDVQKATAGGSFASITGGSPPALAGAAFANSETLTGWTTAVAAGDSIRAVITGTPETIKQVTLVLY